MKRLLIDISHILKACMYVAGNADSATIIEFEGKDHKIPDVMEGYDIFITSYLKTLEDLKMVPSQTVVVKDGANCKEMRRQYLEGYCIRPKGPKEWIEAFYQAQDKVEETILKYGGISVSKDGWEADDIIAALAAKTNHIIWSGDKDLVAAGDVYYQGVTNEDKFFGIAKRHIVVYKSLVGDTSDKIPGCPGFGKKTFLSLVETFGDNGLDVFLELLEDERLDELAEDVGEFKPLQKIIDNQDMIYASYKCAKFYHPGWDLKWKMLYPEGNGELPKWAPTMELVTADKLNLGKIKKLIRESPHVAFDIEGYTTEEGDAWMELNKNKQGKKPLDILGSKMTGFSLTLGENLQHTFYFPIEHVETDCVTHDQARQILNLLPEDRPVVIQNTNYEIPVVRMHYELDFDRGYLPPMIHDTKIMCGYVDEYSLSGLKHNSKSWLGYDQVSYETVTTKYDSEDKPYRVKMNELTGEEVLQYGCDDTICTSSLYRFYKLFMDYEDTWKCYEEVDIAAQFIYAEKFLNGVKFDLDKLEEISEENEKKYGELYSKIQDHLMGLEWVEYIPVEPMEGRVTADNLQQAKELAKKQQEFTEIHHKWPGCEFILATSMVPAEIKRVFLDTFGAVIKTSVRKPDKLAKVFEEAGFPEFAEYVRTDDLAGMNDFCRENWSPKPILNLQSPKQLSSLLYDFMGLPVRIRGDLTDKMRSEGRREGNPSGKESAMQHAIVYDLQEDEESIEFMKLLMEAKRLLTERGLFITPYRKMPHYSDGLVHPQFMISAQKSGRGTAKQPNDAQVAKGGNLRKVYVPYDEDYVWVSMDLAQQEILHTAVHSGDENLMDCFRGGRRCVHSIMGSAIARLTNPDMAYERFNTERKLNDELKQIRDKKAKPTNFQKIYGGTKHSLAIKLLCSQDVSQGLLDIYDEQFPGVTVWQNRIVKECKELGYSVTPLGRRRHVANVMDGSWKDDHEARAGINHPIQGGSAEQVKLIIKRLWYERVYEIFDAYFMGTVHDEINSIVRKDQVIDFVKMVHPIMTQNYANFPLDIQSSIEVGKSFGELIEVGVEIDEEAINKVLETL